MNIRSLTGFLPLADPIRDSDLRVLRDLVSAARADFARADLPIQSARPLPIPGLNAGNTMRVTFPTFRVIAS